jgi:branched-chain amino acid aminotransferase
MKIYIDGQFYGKDDAKISVFDHGLLYGDGIFEGIRFYKRHVFRLKEHIDRLFDSAKAIMLDIGVTPEEMTEATLETCRQSGLDDGYIRLVVTRGVGNLGLNPRLCKKASVIIIIDKITLYTEEQYAKGMNLITCSTRRTAPAALSPLVKSLNYLNNVMAKLESLQDGIGEGVMLNEQGYVAECTGDNIFVVKNGAITTPPCSDGALKGITRQVVFEIAEQLGIPCREDRMTRYEVYTADECFLTGTAAEVIAGVEYDKRVIGDGKPGPITQQVIAKFREQTGTTGAPF